MTLLYSLLLQNLFYLLLLGTGIGVLILILSFVLSPKAADAEKLSAYECGFEPFDDARLKFDVHFYLVSILFLIFDLEIVFLFPWCVYLGLLGFPGLVSAVLFLLILGFGFFYEWYAGALDW